MIHFLFKHHKTLTLELKAMFDITYISVCYSRHTSFLHSIFPYFLAVMYLIIWVFELWFVNKCFMPSIVQLAYSMVVRWTFYSPSSCSIFCCSRKSLVKTRIVSSFYSNMTSPNTFYTMRVLVSN